jgi:hypothetical protein
MILTIVVGSSGQKTKPFIDFINTTLNWNSLSLLITSRGPNWKLKTASQKKQSCSQKSRENLADFDVFIIDHRYSNQNL